MNRHRQATDFGCRNAPDGMPETISARGTRSREPLIFELGRAGRTVVDYRREGRSRSPSAAHQKNLVPDCPASLEPWPSAIMSALRAQCLSIDAKFLSRWLRSNHEATNPRLNEKNRVSSGPLRTIHPMQPEKTVQGALRAVMASFSFPLDQGA